VLREVRLESSRVGCPVEPQGLPERPATLRQREAVRIGVQVSATSRRRTSRVGEKNSVDRDDAQQVRLGDTDPAPDTGSDRLDSLRHAPVYP
jgi:hypothetical protein